MKRYLTRHMLSEKLGNRSRTALWRDVKVGTLPQPIKLGGRNYWIESEIDDAMEARLVATS